jgi:hypothetical protein
MCDTKLISLRMPADLLAKIDAQAERENRSRAQVIVMRCEGTAGLPLRPAYDVQAISEYAKASLPANPLPGEKFVYYENPNAPDIDSRPSHASNCRCYVCKPPAR